MTKMTKTIKTVVFSAMILSLIIPVSGYSMAEAKVSEELPEDKLLKRHDGWKNRYANLEEYDLYERSIHAYVSATPPDNKWNQQAKKNQIIIYNFDTKADFRQAGLNALLIDVQNQKDSGSYNPTEAERRFHEWAGKQVTEPVMPEVNRKHIEKVIQAFNSNANLGNVPTELFNSDKEFWLTTASVKGCDLEEDCDLGEIDCLFGQCAFAASAYHVLSSYVEAYTCEAGSGNSCKYSDLDYGYGVLNTAQGGGENHATTPYIYYWILNYCSSPCGGVSMEVSGSVHAGWADEDIGPVTGTDSIEIDDWVWFGYDICGGSHCGVYNLFAQAEDATY